MHPLFQQAIEQIELAFRRFERAVGPPKLVRAGKAAGYRYEEKSIEVALVQKLARVVSGLRAAALLHANGYLQEQGVMQRTLDEIGEDIAFLAAALTNDTRTEMHDRYLDAFYEEEFDLDTGKPLTRKKRDYPTRDKINAYNIRIFGGAKVNPSLAIDAMRHISKTYSGFVHGSSPHIMDMCYGKPPTFHLSGMLGTGYMPSYQDDLWNYFYRGIMSAIMVANGFGDAEAVAELTRYKAHYEKCSGSMAPNDSDGRRK